jgi:hypothetical protein
VSASDDKKLAGSLVEPGIVLPSQFFASVRRRAVTMSGEYRLALAVLETAVNDFQKYVYTRDSFGRRIFGEVYAWLMNDGDLDPDMPGLTYAYVCEVLGLDPNYLREGLERWRAQAAAEHPAARSV